MHDVISINLTFAAKTRDATKGGNTMHLVLIVEHAECAMNWPIDVVQGMAVVEAMAKLPDSAEKTAALRQLQQHEAHVIRIAAGALLAKGVDHYP